MPWGLAQAHGEADDPLPEVAGVALQLGAALQVLEAGDALPSTALAGYLLRGDAGIDPRGETLAHAGLGLAWRFDGTWGARLVFGRHGSDPVETEAAWLQARWDLDDGAVWRAQLGRMRPAAGAALERVGSMGRFALAPLAQRLALDHPSPEEGLQLGWQRLGASGWTWAADGGLWRGRAFPGNAVRAASVGGSGDWVPSLHLGAEKGAWSVHGSGLLYRPQGRAAALSGQTGQAGHSHASPVCDERLTQVLCFDGKSPLLGASLSWRGPLSDRAWPLTATVAAWQRADRGTLRSANGAVAYQGMNRGLWAEALWQIDGDWSLAWRGERVSARHRLDGPGARLLAGEAGLEGDAAVQRQALSLAHQANAASALHLELGRERQGALRVPYLALRWVVALEKRWSAGP